MYEIRPFPKTLLSQTHTHTHTHTHTQIHEKIYSINRSFQEEEEN